MFLTSCKPDALNYAEAIFQVLEVFFYATKTRRFLRVNTADDTTGMGAAFATHCRSVLWLYFFSGRYHYRIPTIPHIVNKANFHHVVLHIYGQTRK